MYNKPTYTITEKAADYLAKIVETVTRLELGTGFKRDIKLHRENRVRTIHSSLAIEGNSLSLGEVTAVIEGKMVAGKQTEIKEVKNAYEAYDKIMTFDPYAIGDFLKAHQLMTDGLIKESGKFRGGDVGVFDGDVAIHIGARPQYVPQLMEELFGWAKESELHPVLKSACITKSKPFTRLQTATVAWVDCGRHYSLPNGTIFSLGYRWSRCFIRIGRNTIRRLRMPAKRTTLVCLLSLCFPRYTTSLWHKKSTKLGTKKSTKSS